MHTKLSAVGCGAVFLTAALVLPGAAGAAPSTCGGVFQLMYIGHCSVTTSTSCTADSDCRGEACVPVFPQPVPPGNPGDDALRVQIVLGAGSIDNGLGAFVAVSGSFPECQVCAAGTCTTGACDSAAPTIAAECVAVSCDDGNACTADSCDPAVGCVHTPFCHGRCHAAPVCKHNP